MPSGSMARAPYSPGGKDADMRKALMLPGLLGLLAATAAVAGDDAKTGLVGKDAPELQTREWINSDGRTAIADFKGEVVLIEQWKTG